MEVALADLTPVHDLEARLEAARLRAVEALAATPGEPSVEALQSVAHLQMALTAVREEIAAHGVKIGGGGETPLK